MTREHVTQLIEEVYQAACASIDSLIEYKPKRGSPEFNLLIALSTAIKSYEEGKPT